MRLGTRNAVVVVGTVAALFSVVSVYVLLNPGIFRPPEPGVGLEVGQVAPTFTIVDVNNTSWNLSHHRGEVVLLDFMGAHCTTCEIEMSAGGLQALFDTYSPQGFTILSIDVAALFPILGAKSPEEAWRFVHGLNADGSRRWDEGRWPVALDGPGITLEYGVTALPTKYLLDATGKIAGRYEGYSTSAGHVALEAQVVALLG